MQLNFNASQVAPQTQPEPVDTAWYPVLITSAEEKPNSKGTGSYLELGFTIQGGQFANRVVKGRLNLNNPNPQAVEIAQGELSAICHVTGRMQLQHESQLLGAALQIYAIKSPRNDRPGQFSNDIQGYRDMNGNEPGQGGAHGGFAGGQQQPQGQNFGGQQQGNFQQQPNSGGNFQQQPNQQGNGGGGFDPNAGNQQGNFQQQGNQQGGGYQQQPNNAGGYQQQPQGGNQQGGGFQQQPQGQNNFQQGGNQQQGQTAGGPAGGGNMPSWA